MSSTAGLPKADTVRMACGLGNPGRKYAATRHNAGAWCVGRLAALAGVALAAEAKLPVRAAKCPDGLRLAIPTTYMNESGRAVGLVSRYFKVAPAGLLVIYDEIDLAPGVARFKFGGGHAGHNGLRDVILELGTQDFWRLRLGVGHPQAVARSVAGDTPSPEVVDWVLQSPGPADQDAIDTAIDAVLTNWEHVVRGDMDEAMRNVHQDKGLA